MSELRLLRDDDGVVHPVCESPYADRLAWCELYRAAVLRDTVSVLVPTRERAFYKGRPRQVTCLACLTHRREPPTR